MKAFHYESKNSSKLKYSYTLGLKKITYFVIQVDLLLLFKTDVTDAFLLLMLIQTHRMFKTGPA